MRIRTALISIVMPGLGQLFNRQYIKAITFLIIEHLIGTGLTIKKINSHYRVRFCKTGTFLLCKKVPIRFNAFFCYIRFINLWGTK